VHVPNIVSLQQFCFKFENEHDIYQECPQCGKRIHTFWEDPVGDMLSYMCGPQPWPKKIIVLAHNAKAFELHFILNRVVLLNWQQPQLIMKRMIIMLMLVDHLVFLDSISFLPFDYVS
jgi:hypothetical protein